MDQSVIETMKRNYRRQLLRKLLLEGEDEEGVLAESWSLVKPITLKRAWNKLKGISTKEEKEKEKREKECQGLEIEDQKDENDVSLKELMNILLKIPGCSEVSTEDVGEWVACDSTDPGYHILNDVELVDGIQGEGIEEDI